AETELRCDQASVLCDQRPGTSHPVDAAPTARNRGPQPDGETRALTSVRGRRDPVDGHPPQRQISPALAQTGGGDILDPDVAERGLTADQLNAGEGAPAPYTAHLDVVELHLRADHRQTRPLRSLEPHPLAAHPRLATGHDPVLVLFDPHVLHGELSTGDVKPRLTRALEFDALQVQGPTALPDGPLRAAHPQEPRVR